MVTISPHLDIYLKVVLRQRKGLLYLLYTTISSTKVIEVVCSQISINTEIKNLLNLSRMVMPEQNIIHYLCKQWNSSGTS
nr:MAG TPA: hypothetical protein [Bacteriophage sp.]